MRLQLSPQALADLRAIGRFGGRTWGRERARRYVDAIRAVFDLIERFPQIGMPVETIADMRFHSVGSHVVYYRLDEEALVVVRVLHTRQDRMQHLP